MSIDTSNVTLGVAIAGALQDGAKEWHRENPTGYPLGDALAQHVDRIEVWASITVGGPMRLVVKVIDRRSGRTVLTSYLLERSPTSKVLFRRAD